ncbi:MAG: L-threonylcarbamoyladenylate synthase, partial [Phycisphaerae bacterium]
MAGGDVQSPASTASVNAAVDALRSGDLVVLPTETLYGVFADATRPQALSKLRAARAQLGAPTHAPLTWHAAEPEEVQPLLIHDTHRHIAGAVLPGPVRLIVESGGVTLAAVTQRCGPDVLDAALEQDASIRVMSVRVPSDATFAAVAKAGGLLVGERVGLIGLGDGRVLAADAGAIAAKAGVRVVV